MLEMLPEQKNADPDQSNLGRQHLLRDTSVPIFRIIRVFFSVVKIGKSRGIQQNRSSIQLKRASKIKSYSS